MSQRANILLADLDLQRSARIAAILSNLGGTVSTLPDFERAVDHAARSAPALAVLGAVATQRTLLFDAVRRLRERFPALPIVVVVGGGSEATAVAALRAHVNDYFGDPLDDQALAQSLRRLLEPPAGGSAGARGGRSGAGSAPLIGASLAMRTVCGLLDKVAATDATVLITGETGTGKELAAARIHAASPRRHRRFVSVNCAAIPDTLLESELFGHERGAFTGAALARPGLFEQARGGTVLLDEVGDMSPVAQAKVLRAIESREVTPLGGRTSVPLDVRIVAATNQALEQAVRAGQFRKDLYFRLNVARIHLPPLRERRSDIPSLLSHYLQQFGGRAGRAGPGFTDEATALLQQYDWPGNVRELKNLVESVFAFALSSAVGVADLPPEIVERLPPTKTDDSERERLLAVLLEARWNKSRAARQLKCSRMTLYRRMTRLQLVSDRKP